MFVNAVPTGFTSTCRRVWSPFGSLTVPFRTTVVPLAVPPTAIAVVPSDWNCARPVGLPGAAFVTVKVAAPLLPVAFCCVATTVWLPEVFRGTVKEQPELTLPPLFVEHVATSVPLVVLIVPSQ